MDLLDLKTRLSSTEQSARECNVEVHCVPESKSEDLPRTIIQLGNIVSFPIDDKEITACFRVARLKPIPVNNDTTSSTTMNIRPKTIVVKLSSARKRDNFLAAVWKFNKANPNDKLSTSHLGIGGLKNPIFVSEHLSPTNKSLHAATRLRARELNYRFVWTRAGRIYMRKDETSPPIIIKHTEFLKTLH